MERSCKVFILLYLIWAVFEVDSKYVGFDGDDFVALDLNSMPWFANRVHKVKKHIINIQFITAHPNGMLIYIGGEDKMSDFIMLNLVHGKLRVTVNRGDNNSCQERDLRVDDNLADNTWHRALVTLRGRSLKVRISKTNYLQKLKSKCSRLYIKGLTYIGGLTARRVNILREYKPSPNFKGCIEVVSYNEKNIFPRSNENKKYLKRPTYKKHGSPQNLRTCKRHRLKTLSFVYPGTYLTFPSSGRIYMNVSFHFRTYLANEILVSKGGERDQFPFASVSIVEGKVFLKVRMSLGGMVVSLSDTRFKRLDDGDWHNLSVVVNETLIKLAVDRYKPSERCDPEMNKTVNREEELTMFIGFSPRTKTPSFIGCIYDLSIDGIKIDLTNIQLTSKFGSVRSGCNLTSPCFPNPCLHRGKCNEARFVGFNCDCQNTFYRGRFCEKPIYRRTCQDYKELGLAEDAICKVDIDAEGPLKPFVVLCNVTEQKHTLTILSEFNLTEISTFHTVFYSSTLEQIRALINRSEQCLQYVGFRCFGSKLLPKSTGPHHVKWRGIKSHVQRWPDPSSGSDNCTCRVNGTCTVPGVSCKCHPGDEMWREYGGYITDKSVLPILKVFSSKSAAESEFTLGALTCYGTSTSNSFIKSSEKTTTELQREALRNLYTLCSVINPTTVKPRSSISQPPRTPIYWKKYITVPVEMTTSVDTIGTSSSTVTAITKVHKSKAITSYGSVLPPTFDKVTKPVFEDSGLAETKSSTVLQFSTEKLNSDPPLNGSQALSGTNGKPSAGGHNLAFSWQLVVTVILLAVVSIMFVSFVGYCIKKRVIKCESAGCLCLTKTQMSDDYGFVAVNPGSRRACESESPDPRRSFAAGGYNVRTGLILYGDHEKF